MQKSKAWIKSKKYLFCADDTKNVTSNNAASSNESFRSLTVWHAAVGIHFGGFPTARQCKGLKANFLKALLEWPYLPNFTGMGRTISPQSQVEENCGRVPYPSTLEVCSRQGAIQIHVYLLPPLLQRTTSELWCLSGGKSEDYQNCSVLYCILKLCTVISTLRWAVLTVLWIGFCHTRPISLCVDLFVSICVYFVSFCFILHSCCMVGWI